MRRLSIRSLRRTGNSVGLLGAAVITTLAMTLPINAGDAGALTATTPWVLMHTPTSLPGDLSGVSCPTTTFCVAVGLDLSGPITPLALQWTGSKTKSWTRMATPDLGRFATFRDVSCSSPNYCMVVGGTDTGALAELWNGSTWSQTLSPLSSEDDSLSKVSCFGTACMAVGAKNVFGQGNEVVADYWNGQTWATSLSGSAGFLHGVSCFSAVQCLVSGEQSNATALVEYFDAGSWSTEPPPIPSGTGALGIGDCETATVPVTCLGVGEGSNPASAAGTSPIAEFWNSSNQDWTITSPVASISSSGTPQGFTDASCPSASWCVAVGAQFTRPLGGAGTPDPLAEAWSGSRWIRMNTVQVSGPINARYSPFAAVSCPSTTFCVAVGNKRVLTNEQPEVASWGTVP